MQSRQKKTRLEEESVVVFVRIRARVQTEPRFNNETDKVRIVIAKKGIINLFASRNRRSDKQERVQS